MQEGMLIVVEMPVQVEEEMPLLIVVKMPVQVEMTLLWRSEYS